MSQLDRGRIEIRRGSYGVAPATALSDMSRYARMNAKAYRIVVVFLDRTLCPFKRLLMMPTKKMGKSEGCIEVCNEYVTGTKFDGFCDRFNGKLRFVTPHKRLT